MNERAAAGIAANIRIIVEATVCFDLWRREGKGEEMRDEYNRTMARAEANIAQWLMQPMTTKGHDRVVIGRPLDR